jgi:SAM-dependent methyltransferase
MDAVSDLHRYWRQPRPRGGEPDLLVDRTHRSEALLHLISDLPTTTSILEVGCGSGRNLAYLHQHSFHDVEGVEINPAAVEIMRERFPELAGSAIHVGAAEEVLPTLADDRYGLVFTMAVIEHIHPDSSVVFDEMARLAPLILAIEPRGHSSHRQFPHDVPAIFEARGFRLESEQAMSSIPSTADDPHLADYVAWRFRRASS